jgi:hypothetical protein
LLDKYPVPWDKNSTLYKTAKKMSDNVNANMRMLMDSQTGAGDDFNFLSSVRYKFFVSIMKYAEYFRNGDSDSSWKIAPYSESNCTFVR